MYKLLLLYLFLQISGRPVSSYICPAEKMEVEVPSQTLTYDKRVRNAVALYKRELGKRGAEGVIKRE